MPQDKKPAPEKRKSEAQPTKEPIPPKKKGEMPPDIAEPIQQPGGDRKKSEGTDGKSGDGEHGQA
jgi:hypothetical protein